MKLLSSIRFRLLALCIALVVLLAVSTLVMWNAGAVDPHDAGRLASMVLASALALSALLTAYVMRSVLTPLRATVTALDSLTGGARQLMPSAVREDEFGDLHRALRLIQEHSAHMGRIAYTDALTGLGNGARLDEGLRRAIDDARRDGNACALLFLDVDHFKNVNDTLGHAFGDLYLVDAAARLLALAPPDALVCRYSGDEFAVVLRSLANDAGLRAHAAGVAERVRAGMNARTELNGQSLMMSVSIGVCLFPEGGLQSGELMASADAACSLAKREGRNQVQFASRELNDRLRMHVAVAAEIRRGLEGGEFEPFFQPIVDVGSGQVVGAEALLRWHHPSRGIVLPGEFIEVAEESGSIGALGERCLQRGCEQASRWREQGRMLRISVNISARQLRDPAIVDQVRAVLQRTGTDPGQIQFEITESLMMESPERTARLLREFRAMGIVICMDDFGTGYSSLSYLQRFPIDKIKIDRSFIARVTTSREAQAIVTATVALAGSLGLRVVAEGVETPSQMRKMIELGCTVQQGFLLAPAMPAHELDEWLAHAPKQADTILRHIH